MHSIDTGTQQELQCFIHLHDKIHIALTNDPQVANLIRCLSQVPSFRRIQCGEIATYLILAPLLNLYNLLDTGTPTLRRRGPHFTMSLACRVCARLLDGPQVKFDSMLYVRPVARRVQWVQLHHQLYDRPIAPSGASLYIAPYVLRV